MATNGTITNRILVTDALRKIGVVAYDEPMTADQGDGGLRAFNRMLKGWQNKGLNLWGVTPLSITVTTAAVYTLAARPLEILNCRFRRSGSEMPMRQMTRDEYDMMPNKSATGHPTQFYFNRQRETASITIWPLIGVPAGQTLEITYQREFEDATNLNAEPDIPGEFWEAAVYGLAARLADDYTISAPNVVARAEKEYREAMAFDREGSITFVGMDYYA